MAISSSGSIIFLSRLERDIEHTCRDLTAPVVTAQGCARHMSLSTPRFTSDHSRTAPPLIRLNGSVLPLSLLSRPPPIPSLHGATGKQSKSTSARPSSKKARALSRRANHATTSKDPSPSGPGKTRTSPTPSFEDSFKPLKVPPSSSKSHITSAEDLWFQDSLTPSSPSGLPAGRDTHAAESSSSSPYAAQYPVSDSHPSASRLNEIPGPAPHQLPRAPAKRILEPKEHAFCELVAPGHLAEESRVVWSAEENGQDRTGGWVRPEDAQDHWQETVGGKMSAMDRAVESG